MGVFSKAKPVYPPQIPGDEVVPMYSWDDQYHNKAMAVDFTYRFDDVLDATKLKQSLERLLELEGWRKIGGRVRVKPSGKLEYHIPQRYTPERPGFLFAHNTLNQSIEHHPVASRLPKPASVPTVFGDTHDFHEFAHPDHPQTMDDWLLTDKPPLSIQLLTFSDASLLTLSWSHTFLDAMGRETLLKSWTAVLAGREQDVPRFIGFNQDPMDALDNKTPPEKHVLYEYMVTGFAFFLFVVYAILEGIFHPKETTRTVQIPDQYIQKLKFDAREYLREQSDEEKPPFLSDGDVLCAFMAHITIESQKFSPSRTVNILNVYNFRGVSDEAFPPNTAYIGNAVSASQTLVTVRQLLKQPIADTALQIRSSLLKQRTLEQVQAFVALTKRCHKTLGRGPLLGTCDQIMVPFSNWHRARFFEFDFSSAVVRQGLLTDARANQVGRPSFINLTGHKNGFSVRNGGGMLGKDAAGNWWINWGLRAEAWPAFEAKLKEYVEREKLD